MLHNILQSVHRLFEFQKPYFLYLIIFLLSIGDARSQDVELLKKQAEIDPLMQIKLKKQQEELESSKKSLEKFTNVKPDSFPPSKAIVKPVDSNEYNIYGQGVLSQIEPYSSSESRIKATDEYVLGEGDELRVSIWGYSELDAVYKIDGVGSINPKLVGRIYLKGMNYKKAKSFIRRRFSAVYDLKNSQFDIDLAYSKTIQVNVIGEVNNPGTYTVASVNSAFNILSLAGGLNKNASVRSISILRNGKVLGVLDIYDYLMSPETFKNIYMENGDFLVVKPIGSVVSIDGEVIRPYKYELKQGETLKDLLIFCGGLKPKAYLGSVHLNRITNNRFEQSDIDYTAKQSKGEAVVLKNGDGVNIPMIEEKVYGYVEINGPINIPGRYELTENMRVMDLIDKSRGLKFETFLDRAFVIRTNNDNSKTYIPFDLESLISDKGSKYNILLKEFDKVQIFENRSFIDEYFVEIFGAVRKEVKIAYDDGLSLKDLIALAGGLKPEAANSNIEVSRISNFDEANKEGEATIVQTLTVSVNNDLSLGNKAILLLKPFDQIFVRQTPNFEMQQNVVIEGEVKYPGLYSLLTKDERLKDVIERAGGLTEWASMEQSTIKRSKPYGIYSPLLLDLKALYKKNDNEYNYVLEKGDTIYIPKLVNTISVAGAVEYPFEGEISEISIPYKKGKRGGYYVKEYVGGFKQKAKRTKLYVKTPGGKVLKSKKFLGFNIFPKVSNGDRIVVPYKEEKQKNNESGEKVDWNEAIENITIKITGILTLSLLVKNLTSQ